MTSTTDTLAGNDVPASSCAEAVPVPTQRLPLGSITSAPALPPNVGSEIVDVTDVDPGAKYAMYAFVESLT